MDFDPQRAAISAGGPRILSDWKAADTDWLEINVCSFFDCSFIIIIIIIIITITGFITIVDKALQRMLTIWTQRTSLGTQAFQSITQNIYIAPYVASESEAFIIIIIIIIESYT